LGEGPPPAPPLATPTLAIQNYTLDYGPYRALDTVSLDIPPRTVLGLVGESGSGKTSLAYAIMRHLPKGARDSGHIRLDGQDLTTLPAKTIRHIRGARIAMVFQDPAASLNPTLTLGDQLTEVLRRHQNLTPKEANDRGTALLERVGLHHPAQMMRRYPHEASGGEKQRVVIATAFAAEPQLLLLDEPTTALDAITARQILDMFGKLQAETGVAALYISHDLALVAQVATTIAVIHRGRIVETDPARAVFTNPQQPYTQHLVASVPNPTHRLVEPIKNDVPILSAKTLTIRYGNTTGAKEITFGIQESEILGIVGESGSGKSTLARALVGLNPFTGTLTQGPKTLTAANQMDQNYRRAVQMVFQNPDASLNPRQTIATILSRPLTLYPGSGETPAALLEAVQLPKTYATRYPHQLSGGEKQRVAIARAFAARPALIICDEITAALDVSVQAQIITLLLDLRRRHGTAYLFITHDLNLIRQIAHRIAVMHRGTMVELSPTETLGQHPYTRALLAAIPTPIG
jgi:peptide/nickel transport system ATP-binding protein